MEVRIVTKPADPQAAARLGSDLNIHPSLAQILINRGLSDPEQAAGFLSPELGGLQNPNEMPDLAPAAELLARAVMENKKIGLYSDYDADGVTSAAVFALFMRGLGVEPVVYLPNRLTHGYGLNRDGLDQLVAQGVDLLVTADCGSSDHDALAHAAELGLPVIVTDHHQLGDTPPRAAALINPCRADSPEAFAGLAGVGVIFYLMAGLRMALRQAGYFNGGQEPNLKEVLDLVALGTIADVAPMINQNRVLVKTGLELLADRPRLGLAALADVARLSRPLTVRDILFGLAPRINAPGRLGPADVAFELLTCDRPECSVDLARELDRLNAKRQRVERSVLSAAEKQLTDQGDPTDRMALVAVNQEWHQGVLGIVASRLSRKFNRPSFALTVDGDLAIGSGRSIEAVHLFKCLDSVSGHLVQFGGHSQAAGIRLKVDCLDRFTQALEAEVGRCLQGADLRPVVTADAGLDLDDISYRLLADLERLAPFGPGNPDPILTADRVGLVSARAVGRDGAHLSLRVRQGRQTWPAIAFDLGHLIDRLPSSVELAFRPFTDTFRGRQQIKLQVLAIQPG